MSKSHSRRVRYSQNFLHSRRLVTTLVDGSSLGANDAVLEIGPGDGAITAVLLERCRHVIAVEKDPVQVERLARRFTGEPRLTLFAADFLDFPLPHSPYKVFASIPYNATAAIVGKLTTGVAPPDDSHLVVQREAAERFMGKTLASLRIAPWFSADIVHAFRRTDFRPVPAVDSVLLRLERRARPLVELSLRSRYEDLLGALFSAWQPTVREAVRKVLPRRTASVMCDELGGALDRKPGETELDTWIALFDLLVDLDDERAWRAIHAAAVDLRAVQRQLQKHHRTSVALTTVNRRED
jgi:23S rRNA (adenine-N6)-dimethyltransferase